jgi:RNA polymerase sigma-70 factor (ECF subfamily)
LDQIRGIDTWHLFWASRADFLRQMGRLDEAAQSYGRALALQMNESDRRFLAGRLAELDLR